MRKIITLLLTLALLVSVLAACGQDGTSGDDSKDPDVQGPTDVQQPEPEGNGTKDEEPEPEEPEDIPPLEGGEIAETVLFDQQNVKITATGLACSDSGAEVTLLLENNTETSLRFLSGTLGYSINSVNGWMVDDGYLSATVEPGKKSVETVTISKSALDMAGITKIADISLAIQIQDDSFNTYDETGPMRLETSLAEGFDYDEDTYRIALHRIYPEEYGIELLTIDDATGFDQIGVKVLSQALMKNKNGEVSVMMEVENTSDAQVRVYGQDFFANGILIEGGRWNGYPILPGKRAVVGWTVSSRIDANAWTAAGIGDVARVDYSLLLVDPDGTELTGPTAFTLALPGETPAVDTSGTELYNANGVRIIYKGFVKDQVERRDDIHLVLLLENSNSEQIQLDVDRDSMSINGIMFDERFGRPTFPANSTAIIDLELDDSDLSDIGISSIDDITELEFTLEIMDSSYQTMDKPVIKVEK